MKIAYIVSAYKYPDQLTRLINRLSDENTSFFIHVDKKTDNQIYQKIFSSLNGKPNVYFLKRHRCYWGDFGHVNATLKGIKEIIARKIEFDYLILLTGQHYPIKSNSQIKDFLIKNKGKSFITYFPIPQEDNYWPFTNGGLNRVDYWHFCWFNKRFVFPGKLRFNSYYSAHVQPSIKGRILSILWFSLTFWFRLIKRKFPQGFIPFAGDSYWCLPKECVEYIHCFIQKNPKFVNFFKYVDIPDEMFFQTIIINSPFKESVINDNLLYADWSKKTLERPAILREKDFSNLLESQHLFARKFDASKDKKILDMIDTKILENQLKVMNIEPRNAS